MAATKVIVFDVIETLLDLGTLRPQFARHFGNGDVLDVWFLTMIETGMVATIVGDYADFGTIARHALEVVAAARGVRIAEDDRNALLSTIRRLPAHADVTPALTALKAAGFSLATLTNSTAQAAEAQLESANLRPFFDRVISVEATRRFKPAPEVYRYCAVELGIAIGEMRLVAAHDWDVTGAIKAGAKAAFVARPGKVLGPLSGKPDIVGADVAGVVAEIVSRGG
jgi:2-haloacid dehalogenase